MQLSFLDEMLTHLKAIEESISIKSKPFEQQVNNLDTTPGIAITSATAIIAETGIDMSKFPTAEHFCSWLVLFPEIMKALVKKALEAPLEITI